MHGPVSSKGSMSRRHGGRFANVNEVFFTSFLLVWSEPIPIKEFPTGMLPIKWTSETLLIDWKELQRIQASLLVFSVSKKERGKIEHCTAYKSKENQKTKTKFLRNASGPSWQSQFLWRMNNLSD